MQPGKRFLVWLAGLSVLGFLATDMYLPAFAAIQADLQTPASAVSASLSLFLAGFAAAQLLWGPLSDRYGRKPVLFIGLTIFALGSLGMLWVENAATLLTLFPSLARRYLLSRSGAKPLLNTSERAGAYGQALFADCRVETMYLLCLDVKCRLLQAVKLAEGTIDRVPVQNREIIRTVLSTQAKNVLMMHNHPSGSLRPTAEDIDLTRRVMHALESIEVLLVDHLIIGTDGYFSFMNNQIGGAGAKPRPALMYAAEDEL